MLLDHRLEAEVTACFNGSYCEPKLSPSRVSRRSDGKPSVNLVNRRSYMTVCNPADKHAAKCHL